MAQEWNVFPSNAPWIPSTPTARTANKKVETTDGAGVKEAAEQMVLQPDPASVAGEVLTPEEQKILQHLRGLQEMKMQLLDGMQGQLEQLTAKDQAAHQMKPLTHGHLNRLNKLNAQVSSSGKKIEALDEEWVKFKNATLAKIKTHAQLYQQCRSELMEGYNGKLEELRNLKQEMSAASMTMLGASWTAPTVEESPVEDFVQSLQEVIDLEGSVGAVDLTEDMDEEDMEGATVEGGAGKASKPAKTFRGSTSPLKVANQHLKVKAQPQDPKDVKGKETKE